MSDEGRGTGGLDPARSTGSAAAARPRGGRRSPFGQSRPAGAGGAVAPGDRSTRRSISAPTIAGCWSRARPARASGSIDAFSRIIRLGEGISATGRISDPAIDRAVDALGICRDKMRNRGVTRARLIATEACRAAANGAEFRARIAEEVGLELEIIDRETEATLAATGCTPLVDPQAEGVVLFDIGGGSSEIVRLGRCAPTRRGPPLPQIRAWASLPVGVVTLAERYGGHAVTPEIYQAMIDEVQVFVERFVAEQGRDRIDRIHMLGTSGTVTTIAGRLSRAQALRAPPGRRLLDGQRRGRRAWSTGCWP